MYAIVDIETTGGSPRSERITEIAIFIHDGEKITDEYSTLINPERNIPYFITNLTGITNEMVEDAPKFYEVAKDIVKITEGKTFVAHNARFDYSFIRQEFKNLGFNYIRNLLDTLSLGRKLLPGYSSYSLDNICKDLGIDIDGRHRARSDALATVKLFEILLEAETQSDNPGFINNTKLSKLNPDLDISILGQLPEDSGVYYFYDNKGQLIYIGKSKNIKQRVMTHLSNNTSKRAMEMRDAIAGITWKETGSELIALLMESEEIKLHKPKYNRAQRRTGFHWGIYHFYNEKGYLCFEIRKINEDKGLLSVFTSRVNAKQVLENLLEKYELCQKLCGLYESPGECFHHQVSICKGACCGEEVPAAYNLRSVKAMNDFVFSQENFFLIDSGRHDEEKCAVKIINGKYIGYGYFDINEVGFGLGAIHDCIKPSNDNRDIQVILKGYLKRNKIERVLKF
ncbi:MAG TPA: exonuclease domain-containing protein [Bacteroidales bacterium]|nr:exonuclease domain-containing protein [Bacteroidales bacterium]